MIQKLTSQILLVVTIIILAFSGSLNAKAQTTCYDQYTNATSFSDCIRSKYFGATGPLQQPDKTNQKSVTPTLPTVPSNVQNTKPVNLGKSRCGYGVLKNTVKNSDCGSGGNVQNTTKSVNTDLGTQDCTIQPQRCNTNKNTTVRKNQNSAKNSKYTLSQEFVNRIDPRWGLVISNDLLLKCGIGQVYDRNQFGCATHYLGGSTFYKAKVQGEYVIIYDRYSDKVYKVPAKFVTENKSKPIIYSMFTDQKFDDRYLINQ